ncbi:Ig-like domain-containing protein [Desulfofalx alkaliphila]|uniref:Ig-like domain-containing protein n=1 Tax=Desulfofalx alkaliphila TaxID=105483 RepID=UPI0004E172B4|nr:Ig-like domain-containing protein [Desulfofalx alkaliphila]
MALHITFRQMKLYALAIVSMLTLWLIMGHLVWVKTERVSADQISLEYYFLSPMGSKAMEGFTITSEIPGKGVNYSYSWQSPFHLKVLINEDYPRGIKYHYSFKKAKALIPPFTVTKKGTVLSEVIPELVSIYPEKNAPTKGPITLTFNTPIEQKSLNEMVTIDAEGKFYPLENDSSRWQFIPDEQLQYQKIYKITVKPGIKSKYRLTSNKEYQASFTTAPQFKVTETYPRGGDNSLWLSRTIKITTNQPIKEAAVTGNLDGEIQIDKYTLQYKPRRILSPNTQYQIKARITSIYQEKIDFHLSFKTTNIGNQRWLEIKAGNPCLVWLMEGKKELGQAEAWFTGELDKLPRVTMYESGRGRAIAHDNKESLPWVKLNTDILLHATTHSQEDNHRRLSLPRAYSCILLPNDIMNRISKEFENGFMVIVH